MDKEVRDLLDEFGVLEEDRKTTEDTWQDIADNIVPNRSGFDGVKGERHGSEIQDGGPQHAVNVYRTGMMGTTLPFTIQMVLR
jgi:hypothetical protein